MASKILLKTLLLKTKSRQLKGSRQNRNKRKTLFPQKCYKLCVHYTVIVMMFNELSSLRCYDVTFNSDHIVLKITKSKTDVYRRGNEKALFQHVRIICCREICQQQRYQSILTIFFKPAIWSKHISSFIKKNKCISYTRA